MFKKVVASLMVLVLLSALAACSSSTAPVVKIVVSDDQGVDREVARVVGVENALPLVLGAENTIPVIDLDPSEAEDLITVKIGSEQLPQVETPAGIMLTEDMRFLFQEMPLVQLISDTYQGWAITACASSGLDNVKGSSHSPTILVPNAGDLSIGVSTVAIQIAPNGEVTFIPRVASQRIKVPMDLGTKKAGEEVQSLTFEEGLRLMTADMLIWTARDQGPYGNGLGIPGHIAICDPIIAGQSLTAPTQVSVTKDVDLTSAARVPDALPYTKDIWGLFEEMTFVQLEADINGWAKTSCAGVGLKNIAPLASGPRILIPNAGDLSVAGSTVAVQLNPDGEIVFIPRTPGQRIRVPMDLGQMKTGDEVLSLTHDEGMRLMAAGMLVWTAESFGIDGSGHGLPGHIATCDPRYAD
jgi:hypothetical protein